MDHIDPILDANHEPPSDVEEVSTNVELLIFALVHNLRNLETDSAFSTLAANVRRRFQDIDCCSMHRATADLAQIVAVFLELIPRSDRIRVLAGQLAVPSVPPTPPPDPDDPNLN